MECPCCRVQLVPEPVDGQPIDKCSNCDGAFASHQALHSILLAEEGTRNGVSYSRPSPLSDLVRYRKCPACGETMLRRNFAGASGVVIDVCPVHGLWFDRGELATVIEFAATGAWKNAERGASERANARKRLDAWLQELRLGAPQHGQGVGGLGEIARLIPVKDRDR